MQINIEKVTDVALLRWACSMTIDSDTAISPGSIYACEHSPMRTQLFKVEMLGIYTFVSTHFCRHTQGVDHFCKTQRDDRGGSKEADRWTPTNHGMLVNAQALVNMARKRLCYKSHIETVNVMQIIKNKLTQIDRDLGLMLMPECSYRGGVCHEAVPCGMIL